MAEKCSSLAACDKGWAKLILPHINLEIRWCNLLQDELLQLRWWTCYAVMTCWCVRTVKSDGGSRKFNRVGLGTTWEQSSSWTKARWIGHECMILKEKLGWPSKEKIAGDWGGREPVRHREEGEPGWAASRAELKRFGQENGRPRWGAEKVRKGVERQD